MLQLEFIFNLFSFIIIKRHGQAVILKSYSTLFFVPADKSKDAKCLIVCC
uniref:Uncharacterized protein n=1 Tax=uncultured Desulfobacterium sp. TaxID=201089 RepID=E1YGN3_9BACT|nr:unknown protein [uncultured Desulfobacterium sp.]